MTNSTKKTLHLTLKKKYFYEILNGTKTEEYREVKGYWVNRLTNMNDEGSVKGGFYKKYDVVRFKNGYGSNAPWFDIEFKGIHRKTIVHEMYDNNPIGVFAIQLGQILNKNV